MPFGGGSEDGARVIFITESGVAERDMPVNLRAMIRRGEIDSDMVLAALDALDMRGALIGVMRYRRQEVLEPASLDVSPLKKIFLTFSISASVREIRSRRFLHL